MDDAALTDEEIAILWACLAVGRRDERIVTSYADVITEATDRALVGKQIRYEAFSR